MYVETKSLLNFVFYHSRFYCYLHILLSTPKSYMKRIRNGRLSFLAIYISVVCQDIHDLFFSFLSSKVHCRSSAYVSQLFSFSVLRSVSFCGRIRRRKICGGLLFTCFFPRLHAGPSLSEI